LVVLLTNAHANDVDELAERFFTNKSVRRKVDKLLLGYGLTEAAIDAEAFRQSIDDLAHINRRLAELAFRRDKVLRLLEEHRAGLATPCSLDAGGGN
jgi:butyrate kinase